MTESTQWASAGWGLLETEICLSCWQTWKERLEKILPPIMGLPDQCDRVELGRLSPFILSTRQLVFPEVSRWCRMAFFPHSFIPRSPHPRPRASHLFFLKDQRRRAERFKVLRKAPHILWNGKCFCGGLDCEVDLILSNCKFNPIQHVQMVVIPTGTQWSVHYSSNPCLIWLDYNVSIWVMIANYTSLCNGPNATWVYPMQGLTEQTQVHFARTLSADETWKRLSPPLSSNQPINQ